MRVANIIFIFEIRIVDSKNLGNLLQNAELMTVESMCHIISGTRGCSRKTILYKMFIGCAVVALDGDKVILLKTDSISSPFSIFMKHAKTCLLR